jgi:hypothetical protein
MPKECKGMPTECKGMHDMGAWDGAVWGRCGAVWVSAVGERAPVACQPAVPLLQLPVLLPPLEQLGLTVLEQAVPSASSGVGVRASQAKPGQGRAGQYHTTLPSVVVSWLSWWWCHIIVWVCMIE